ncbi:MAG: FHA domain-containing protein [Anaerolineae bacterium]|nr:FHA domain-containing protein [Anaerolineae bacterium]
MTQAKIRVQMGGMPREFPLPRDPGAVFIIGRGKDANLQFESTPEYSYISNRHCHIRYVGDGYVVIDGSVDGKPSSAGTYVNGGQVFADGKPLAVNDEIKLGNLPQSVKMQFVMEDAPAQGDDYMATNIYMEKPSTAQQPIVSPPPISVPPPVAPPPMASPPPQQTPQNPFGSTPVTNPYGMPNPSQPPQNPYEQKPPSQPNNPYNQPPQNPYGQPQQNPYGQPQNPYGQPQQNPYGQPPSPYGQPPSPYGQPAGNPYGQPQNPYGQPQMGYGQQPSPYGQPYGMGGYPQAGGGFPFVGLIISVVAGAIFFALYQFISLELLIASIQGTGIQDQTLYFIVIGVIYTIAFALTGIVLAQTLKPMSIVTMLTVAIVVGTLTTIIALISANSTSQDTVQLLDWIARVAGAVFAVLILSNFNKFFGANGEPRLSIIFMVIVAILWVAISWVSTEIASNSLQNARDFSGLRLTVSLIGAGTGAAITALLFLALKFSGSSLQKGGNQIM